MQEERCLVSRDYQDTIFERRKKRVMLKQLIEREKLEERRIIHPWRVLKRKERIKQESYARRKMSRE